MAHTPNTIKVDILMRVYGAAEADHVATVDLPVQFVSTSPGLVRQTVDTNPIAEAGKAIADALRKVADDNA